MKASGVLLLAAAVIVLVSAVSNPSESDFLHWYEAKVSAASAGEEGASGLLAKAKGVALALSTRATVERENYVLFSVFRSDILGKKQAHIGVLGQFFSLD